VKPVDQAKWARFEAVRRSIFADMARASARMRLMWVVPFNVLVLGLLVARGLSGPRTVAFFVGDILVTVGLFAYQAIRPSRLATVPSFTVGFGTYVVGIAATGGLSSPLVPLGLSIIVAASLVLPPTRAKSAFFAFVVAMYVLFALLSHTVIGALPPPLAPTGGRASPEFVVIAGASLVFIATSLFKYGRTIASAYEHIAFELMARREELCSENEDRTRALEGIAARMAHEVKNPLAAIKALSTHVARSSSDPKTAERLSIVAAEADRLQAIVEGYLDFSHGLDDLVPESTKPYDVARELTLLLETRAADAGVTLEVAGDAKVTLEADPRKLRQALLNLVLNAVQASPRGERVTVAVGNACPMGTVVMKVTDHGPGMSPDVLNRIKKPYFTTREGGTGLGVAVARGLIEQHGGTLDYDSTPGKGTTVIVRLPKDTRSGKVAPLPKVKCGVARARAEAWADPSTDPAKEPAPAPHEGAIGAKV
jgi:signal transduction histidine kinase